MGFVRYTNAKDIRAYIDGARSLEFPREVLEQMDNRELARERMIMGLRLTRGVDLERLARDFGENLVHVFDKEINSLINSGMLEKERDHLRLTPAAYLVANQVFCRF
jgi:oxygen-independent coproporphyrinogen-3 oxidase